MRLSGYTPVARVRLLPLLLACCLALASLAACSMAEPPAEEFRIGFLLPLSSTPSLDMARRAAELLVARVNAEGGLDLGGRRVKVRLLVEDTGGQVERIMTAATRLIQQERVSALVGPYYSREALPVAAVAENSQIPLVSPTAGSESLTRGRRFIFRVCMVDTLQGAVMARFAFEDLNLRRVAVLYDEADAYSFSLARLFDENFALLGGQVVAREFYATGAMEFTAQLARIQASGVQGLYLPNFTGEVPRQMAQARAAGFGGVFLGSGSWSESQTIFGLPQAEGAFFSSNYAADVLSEKLGKALGQFAAQGITLDTPSVMTLDALGVILAGAKAAGSTDPVSLREGIASLRGYEGYSGRLSFEQGGDAVRGVHIMVIEGRQVHSRKVVEATP